MSSVSMKRTLIDVSNATGKNAASLAESGIYYFPNEADIKQGLALIVGPTGTPYFGGFYFFSVNFPADYPFSPLVIRTLTQDGTTRFNPNMYKDGKVCLSILNTWHDGPQWSGVQSLESVLRVILSDVLIGNPIENEPAYRRCGNTEEAKAYARCVGYANLHTAILGMLTKPAEWAEPHIELMRSTFAKNSPEILTSAQSFLEYEGLVDLCRVFGMRIKYTNVADLVENLKRVKS